MTTVSIRSLAWSGATERTDAGSPTIIAPVVRLLAIVVALQLGATIAFPNQTLSMPLGVVALCYLAAGVTMFVAGRERENGRLHATLIAIFFALKGSAWLVSVVADGEHGAFFGSLISFISQFVMTQALVPRGRRRGAGWSATFDILGGIALCMVMATRFWTPMVADATQIAPRYLPYLEYCLYPALAVASLIVQRRDPPPLLAAFVATICLYALTSILSLALSAAMPIASNSPVWIYGDTALIAYPLLATATWFRRRTEQPGGGTAEADHAPNPVVPVMFALALLTLAFGYALRAQTLASLVGAVGLLLYVCRVGFVTWRYHRAQAALVAAGRQRVEAMIDVVHELRSPLASVVLNASALARAQDVPPMLKTRVDTIAHRCGTVTQLLNDVLDLERIEAGMMAISVAPVDVSAVCRDALTAVATTAEAVGVAIRGPGECAQPFRATGDGGLLARVVVNLLDNAIRFTPAGGMVTVSIGHVAPSQIAVVVEDTGIGLSPEARATLFTRFGHAAAPVNGARGSGLGLSIAATAIAAMHGRLDLMPRDDGPGTRATILLRRA